jgi:hypothetical protein
MLHSIVRMIDFQCFQFLPQSEYHAKDPFP